MTVSACPPGNKHCLQRRPGVEEERTHKEAAELRLMLPVRAELQGMLPIHQRKRPRPGWRGSAGERKGQSKCCEGTHLEIPEVWVSLWGR